MERIQYMVAHLPYLSMGDMDEIDLGFAKVWNFCKKKDEYIKDERIRKHLEKIFGMYKTLKHPITGIGVISFGTFDFRPLTDEERKKLRKIQNLLFLGYTSENNTIVLTQNTGHSMVTSDNFELVLQKFVLEDDYVSEHTGVIVQVMIGGWKATEVTIQRPSFVLTSARGLDMELVGTLQQLEKKKPRIFERIMSATEIFMESYYNSPQVSQNARILLLTSAFEIMLNLPVEGEARKAFKDYIRANFTYLGEKEYRHFSKRRGRKVLEQLTMKEIWADKLFTLRNDISHGERIDSRRYYFSPVQSHAHISLLFFLLFVRKQMEKSIGIDCDILIRWRSWKNEIEHPKPRRYMIFEYDAFTLLFMRMSGGQKKKP